MVFGGAFTGPFRAPFGDGGVAALLPFSDAFARTDGALGNGWTGATWAVASGRAVNVPTLESSVVTNGTFDSNITGWTNYGGALNYDTLEWQAGTLHIMSDGVGASLGGQSSILLETQRWYQFCHAATLNSGTMPTFGVSKIAVGGAGYPNLGYQNGLALQVRRNPGDVANVAWQFYATHACDLIIDDVAIQPITLSTLFAARNLGSANVDVSVKVTCTTGTQAGLVLCLDNLVAPANFLVVYIDGASRVNLDKCVAGTYTNIVGASNAVAYGADRVLRVVKAGTGVSVYYNGTQVGTTQTVSDGGIVSSTTHGLFSTYSGNSFDDFSSAAT